MTAAVCRAESAAPSADMHADYTADLFGVEKDDARLLGGLGVFNIGADLDLPVSAHGLHAHVLARAVNGHALTASAGPLLSSLTGIEATPGISLAEAWVAMQPFDDAEIKVGQMLADQDFFVGDTSAFFVNGTFGWPSILSDSLPNGAPGYPDSWLGLVASTPVTRAAGLKLAGYGWRDANEDIGNWAANILLAETEFHLSSPGPGDDGHNRVKLGAWISALRSDFNAAGLPSRSLQRQSGVYLIADRDLWLASRSTRRIAGFMRMAYSSGTAVRVSGYGDFGLKFDGFIPHRPEDSFGVAVSGSFLPDDTPARRVSSSTLELTYRSDITPHLALQPDVQWLRPVGSSHRETALGIRVVIH